MERRVEARDLRQSRLALLEPGDQSDFEGQVLRIETP